MTKMMLIVRHSAIPVNKIYWFELIQGVGKWGVNGDMGCREGITESG